MLLKRFRDKNHDVQNFLPIGKSPGRPFKLIGSEAIEWKLLSPLCLRNWAHMSLKKRCAKIARVHNVRVTYEGLRRFYLRNGVRKKPTSTRYYPHGKSLALLEAQRMEFALKLAEYISEGVPIMYFDESSMNAYQCQKSAWYPRHMQFQVPVATSKDRGSAFTIYGAVGDCIRGNGYFEVHDSTNKIDFASYLRSLKARMLPQPVNVVPVLVLDNH